MVGRWRDWLYRVNGWNLTGRDAPREIPVLSDRALEYDVTYTAGWVMPDEITEWSGGATIPANAWFASTDVDEPMIFQADATGGTAHASTEPTWPTVAGGTVDDNGVTFTAHEQRLPEPLEEAAMMLAAGLFEGSWSQPAGIKSEAGDGYRIEYKDVAGAAISNAVRSIIGAYA